MGLDTVTWWVIRASPFWEPSRALSQKDLNDMIKN